MDDFNTPKLYHSLSSKSLNLNQVVLFIDIVEIKCWAYDFVLTVLNLAYMYNNISNHSE